MPTYQYACTACDERLEAVQKFSDDPLTECSECGGRLRKVFSPVGIVFKGSGFYRTDSRNGSVNGSSAKSKDSSPGSEDKKPATSDSGSSAGDTKPATKSDAATESASGKSGSTGTKVA